MASKVKSGEDGKAGAKAAAKPSAKKTTKPKAAKAGTAKATKVSEPATTPTMGMAMGMGSAGTTTAGNGSHGARSANPELDEIWGRVKELGLEQHVAELDAYGLTVIPPERAAPPGFTDRLTEKILDIAEERHGVRPDLETGEGYENRFGPSLYFLGLADRIFEEAVMNPMSLTLIDYLMGYSSLLNFCGATLKGPGTDEFALHADQGPFPPPLPAASMTANATYVLSDYTKENGALMWVPGSHKWCRNPTPGEGKDLVVPLEAPAGSIAVWHGNTWHGAYPRTTPGLRVTLITSYRRMHMRTQELYRERVTEEILDRNPPRFARLMGQHVIDGWDEGGPSPERLSRLMKYGGRGRPGASIQS